MMIKLESMNRTVTSQLPLSCSWQHMLSPVSIMEQTDSSLKKFPGPLVRATRRTCRIFKRTISSETESLASNLQCVAATARRCMACAALGESLSTGTRKYVVNNIGHDYNVHDQKRVSSREIEHTDNLVHEELFN